MAYLQKFKKISIYALIFLIIPLTTLAQTIDLGLDKAQEIGLPAGEGGSLMDSIIRIVQLFLSFVGLIMVLIIMYSGLLWMLSMGNEERTAQAKKTFINAIIGLVIIMLSFVIVNFVISNITSSLGGSTATTF